MGRRFAFDIGTNSIGFAVWRTGPDPNGIFGVDAPLELIWSGVRIFKDGRNPKDGSSLAQMRRIPKQARKRRDRFVLRREDLLQNLVEAGLMPAEAADRKALESLDPYQLRANGLDKSLSPYEFGRALFHLHQRRGFKSNRKTDKGDKDKGKIAQGAAHLAALLEERNCRTFGEFLWQRHRGASHDPKRVRDPGRQPTRIRLEGEGAKALYDFYPTRAMVQHEFELLWKTQASFHPALLTEALHDRLKDVLFRQRNLKPPKIGKCTFEPGEERLPKALPSVEVREIYERLAHLRVIRGRDDLPLFPEERNAFASLLLSGKALSFNNIRKTLKIPSNAKINFEEAGGEDFKGVATAKYLSKPDHYGKKWLSLTLAEKDAFVEKLLEEIDEDRLVARLMAENGLAEEAARKCASVPLPDGYSRLGATANAAILDALENECDGNGRVITYAEAVKRAGARSGRNWHHSDERDGEIFPLLPYYGQVLQRHVLPGSMEPEDKKKGDEAAFWGRITNPTVHIGLNQLRRVTNELIESFGAPDQIVVELARDLKLNEKQKEKERLDNRKNRDANLRRLKRLEELGQDDRRENILRLRLFEEQAAGNDGVATCPYTGRTFGLTKLFSDEIEIDHILPVSRTLDDSLANQVLVYREANRRKRKQSPYEAFGSTPEWEAILARSESLPPPKRWRFKPDAMQKFEGERSFLERQLNETKYLSRVAKAYLGKICDPDQVYVTPGKLVGMLRGKWGLNSLLPDHNRAPDADGRKVRTDHRHHAIDAIVIGALTRGLINHLAHAAGQAEDEDLDRIFGKIPIPFENFRDVVRASVEKLIVSNKPEHGKRGALHEDTAYGFVRDKAEAAAIGNLVYRKPAKDLTEGEIARVRDQVLRGKLDILVAPLLDAKGKAKDQKEFKETLASFGEKGKIRRLRLGKFEAGAVSIYDRKTGAAYKALTPGENHHVDIVQMRDGTWKGFAASVFDVNRKDWRPLWEREKLGGKLVMRLHKGDMVEIDDADGIRRVKVVQRIEISANRIRLAPHQEGGKLQDRHADKEDPFQWDFATISKLKERECLAIRVVSSGFLSYRSRNI
jgi:CRISPR-associated endonuclease Csn1